MYFQGYPVSVWNGTNTTVNIPYNLAPNAIFDGLLSIGGNYNIEYYYYGNADEGLKYVFTFRGVSGSNPLLSFDYTNLTGGTPKPNISLTYLQNSSKNYFYEPIPDDMLAIPANYP